MSTMKRQRTQKAIIHFLLINRLSLSLSLSLSARWLVNLKNTYTKNHTTKQELLKTNPRHRDTMGQNQQQNHRTTESPNNSTTEQQNTVLIKQKCKIPMRYHVVRYVDQINYKDYLLTCNLMQDLTLSYQTLKRTHAIQEQQKCICEVCCSLTWSCIGSVSYFTVVYVISCRLFWLQYRFSKMADVRDSKS